DIRPARPGAAARAAAKAVSLSDRLARGLDLLCVPRSLQPGQREATAQHTGRTAGRVGCPLWLPSRGDVRRVAAAAALSGGARRVGDLDIAGAEERQATRLAVQLPRLRRAGLPQRR